MSKRPTKSPGVFSRGLHPRHYNGGSNKAKRLAAKAENARLRLVQWLGREHRGKPDAGALAVKLTRCTPARRCLSGACPACAQAAQEQFVSLALHLMKRKPR